MTSTPTATPTPRYQIVTQTGGYYEQFITVEGITVKASGAVQVDSMYGAADVIGGMTRSLRNDIRTCLTDAGAGLAIAPEGENITTLPEFHPLRGGESDRAAGLGAGIGQPISGVHEDGLLYGDYENTVHEFAHAIQDLCFSQDDHNEWNRFYRRAREAGLFPDAYGMTNEHEFFAEFSESYLERPGEIQRRWDEEDDELTRQRLSGNFPEIFKFLEGIYEGWEVGSYFSPDLGWKDRNVLVALYNSTDGPNWTNNENWLSDRPLREWYGVTVGDNRRVARLELPQNRLKGAIPPELGNLANMWVLDLSSNRLTGQIPGELALTKLYELYLGENQLSGEIPVELGSLVNLEVLTLGNNQLSGEIPPELGRLGKRSLVWLSLSGNQLTGQIPTQLAILPMLKGVWLADNPLSGCIPVGLRDVPDNDLSELNLPSC